MSTRKGCDCGTQPTRQYWLNVDGCGLFCALIVYFLVLFGMYATTYAVIYPVFGFHSLTGGLHLIIYNGISVLAIYCHLKAMTTDPGAVPPYAVPLSNDDDENDIESANNDRDINDNHGETRERFDSIGSVTSVDMSIMNDKMKNKPSNIEHKYKKYCAKCKAFKPSRAHHCSACQRCIIKMDHHCPWINNCVGIGNHKFFLLFILWIFVISVYSLCLICTKFSVCYLHNEACEGNILSLLLLLFEAIIFGLFTLCMMGDQASVILTNQTQIDRMKNKKHVAFHNVNEVFGGSNDAVFRLDWILPTNISYPPACKYEILGYMNPYETEHEVLISQSNSDNGVEMVNNLGNSDVEFDYSSTAAVAANVRKRTN